MSIISVTRRAVATFLPRTVKDRIELWRVERNEAEIRLVRDLLAPGETLLDVGANSGVYVLAGLAAGARVVAVEPQSELAARLRARWADSPVVVVESAISTGTGFVTLYRPLLADGRVLDTRSSLAADANEGFETVTASVPTTTVDALCAGAESVAVLKVDVEGLETDVLRSASGLLDGQRPAVLVEVERRHHRAGDPWAAFAFLAAKGYQGWFLAGGRRLEPLAAFDPDVHQPDAVVKDPRSVKPPAGYVNNFLFVHPENAGRHLGRLGRNWQIL